MKLPYQKEIAVKVSSLKNRVSDGRLLTYTFCFMLFVLILTENVVKPKCVQSLHGRPSAVNQIEPTVYSIKSSVSSIHFATMTKIHGQRHLMLVQVIGYLIVVLLVPVVRGAVESMQ